MREFLVAYSEYEQQLHITNQDGGDRMLARRRELVDSATQIMVADEFYVRWQALDRPLRGGVNERAQKVLLALICSKRVMRVFAARYSVRSRWMRACQ